MAWLKQSTATFIAIGPFIDDVDFKTLENGLTIASGDIFASKTAGGYAAIAAGGATLGQGDYQVALSTTDTNTLGVLRIACTKTGALPVWHEYEVVPAAVYDALMAGTGKLDGNVTHWAGTAVATPHTAGYPVTTIKDGTGAGEIDLTSGVVLAKDHAGANLATAAQGTAIQAKTDNLPSDPADQSLLTAQIAALENVSAAQVKTQVVDALTVDTYAEIGQEAPAATTTFSKMWRFLYKAARNKVTQTGSEYKLYNDAGDTVDQKSALTDDSTVYQKGKVGSGP